ncbi:MAG: alpha/beta hydrolase [Candidatus Borkfalkiaceae bacterium]|nr:alpha/beta hydrolase [Clostridia bacterium]MDY6223001.1 alpha/beta hydrolase [Christensenellaceae bacterium]
MQTFDVDLKKEYGTEGGTLTAILSGTPHDSAELTGKWTRPAVIVVPGGGYHFVSMREAEPVAQAFLAKGFHCFILTYLVSPDGAAYPEQLTELAAAVDYVKKHAKEMHVNSEEIFAVGFSAGGHLVGDLAVEWQNVAEITGKDLDCKVTATGLCYAVISSKAGHVNSFDNLLQGYTSEAREEALKKLDLNNSVSEKTPPAFLWSTAADTCVPSENTLLYALELAKRKIPYELHVYPECQHGASTGNYEINAEYAPLRRAARWVDDCCYFFRLFISEKF